MRVAVSRVARAEAREARVWFQDRDPRTVQRFRARMKDAIAQLRAFPASGEPHLKNTRRLTLAPFPYSLIYRIEAKQVEVIAVAHDAQQQGYWTSRD